MSYFEKNLAFLKERDRADEHLIQTLGNVEVYAVQKNRRGEFWLEIQGEMVHGKVAPRKEAIKVLRNMESEVQIHVGFGLGYYLSAQQERFPESASKLYILEPDQRILKTMLEVVDLEQLFGSRPFQLFCAEKAFLQALELGLEKADSLPFFVMPYHRRRFGTSIERITQKLRRLVEQRRYNAYSDRKLGPVFAQSTLRSLSHWMNAVRFDQIMMRLKDRPAVVISPGPSLEKNLHQLVAFRERVVVIAVSRVVRILERYGIEPDFLVHIEAQDFFELIDGASNLVSTYFILQEQVEAKYFQYPSRGVISYHNANNKMAKLIYEAIPEAKRMSLPTGGSVAHDALSAAVFLGCNPIALIGQDLALHGSRMYSSGTEGTTQKFPTQPIKGFFGFPVETLNNYNQFRIWFEEAAEAYRDHFPELKLYNATEGGAHIEGFQPISFAEFLFHTGPKGFCVRSLLKSVLNKNQSPNIRHGQIKDLLNNWLKEFKNFSFEKWVETSAQREEARTSADQTLTKLGAFMGGNIEKEWFRLTGESQRLALFEEVEAQKVQIIVKLQHIQNLF